MFYLCYAILLPSCLHGYYAEAFQNTVDVISAEGRDVLLPINETEVSEISWIFALKHIATTKPNGKVEVKNTKYRGRLHGVEGGSLKISKVTKKDQGTYTANVFREDLDEDHQQFRLKVYPILSHHDINILVNATSNGTCSLALTCQTNALNVTVLWNYPNGGGAHISGRTLHIYDVYLNDSCTCNAENPVSKVSRTVTPWQFCQEEGPTNQRQMDGSSQTWIVPVLIIIIVIITVIGFIFSYYKAGDSKFQDFFKMLRSFLTSDHVKAPTTLP